MLKPKLITILSIVFFALSFNISRAECNLNLNNLSINNQTNTDKADIVRLQTILYINELYDGPITGYYGNLTSKAINNLKKQYNLKQDGIVDESIVGIICNDYALCPFQSNLQKEDEYPPREIKALQSFLRLIPNIYPERLVTGYYGSKTENAVKRLQKQLDISQTGKMDPTTRRDFCNFFDSFDSIGSTTSSNITSIFQTLCLAFPKQVKTGDNVLFISQILGGTSPYKYIWNNKDTNNDKTFKTMFPKSGTYTVGLKVIDSKGNISSTNCSVNVIGESISDLDWNGLSLDEGNMPVEKKDQVSRINMTVNKEIIKMGERFTVNWSTGNIPAYFCKFSASSGLSNVASAVLSRINQIDSLPGEGVKKYDVASGKFDSSLFAFTTSGYFRIDCLDKNNEVVFGVLYVEKDKPPRFVYNPSGFKKLELYNFPKLISRDEFGVLVGQTELTAGYFEKYMNVDKALQSGWEGYFERFLHDAHSYGYAEPIPQKPFLEDWIQIWTYGGIKNEEKHYSREMIFVYPIFSSKMIKKYEESVDLGYSETYNKLIPRIRKQEIKLEQGELMSYSSYVEKDLSFNYLLGRYPSLDNQFDFSYEKWKENVLAFMKGETYFRDGLNYQIASLKVEDKMGVSDNTFEVVYILDYFLGNEIYKSEVLDTYTFIAKTKGNNDGGQLNYEGLKNIFFKTNPSQCKLDDLGVRKECDEFFYNSNICSVILGKSFDNNMIKHLPNCLHIAEIPSVSF